MRDLKLVKAALNFSSTLLGICVSALCVLRPFVALFLAFKRRRRRGDDITLLLRCNTRDERAMNSVL